MAQGNYDHPAYVTRQVLNMGLNTAGAAGTSGSLVLPWDVNVHNLGYTVAVAGTATNHTVALLNGTATMHTFAVGTGVALVTGTSGDKATKVTAGTKLALKTGPDATGTVNMTVEYNIAPDTGTWLGTE